MAMNDIIGQTYGKLHIDSYSHKVGYDKYYNCTCECGNKVVVLGNNIVRGKTKSCGCGRFKPAINRIDRTGQKYNMLTCIMSEKKDGALYWLCRCDCGRETWVRGSNLVSGAVKSCGCIMDHQNRVHGMSHTRIHRIWSKMQERCYNANKDTYKYYGGRGIEVCDEWRGTEGFIRFMEWAFNNGYSDELTIDRINVDGNYCPENCRWADKITQANNTRVTKYYDLDGRKCTVRDLSNMFNIPSDKIRARIYLGWTIRQAVGLDERRRNGNHE